MDKQTPIQVLIEDLNADIKRYKENLLNTTDRWEMGFNTGLLTKSNQILTILKCINNSETKKSEG